MGANMVSLLGRSSELMGFDPLYPSNVVSELAAYLLQRIRPVIAVSAFAV